MLKILVVDDETPIRQWFAFCIEKNMNNCEVIGQAANGKEALEIFKRESPDIVITDIKMPVMDGLELMRQVKSIEPSTDVVILTCHTDFEYALQAVKMGAAEYMLKTEVSDKEMTEILKKIGKRRQEQKEAKQAVKEQKQVKWKDYIWGVLKCDNLEENKMSNELFELGLKLFNTNLFAIAIRSSLRTIEIENKINEKLTSMENLESWQLINYQEDINLLVGNLRCVPSQLMQMNSLILTGSSIAKNLDCPVGMSYAHNGLISLPICINEALKALEQSFLKGKNSISFMEGSVSDKSVCHGIENIKNDLLNKLGKRQPEYIMEKLKELLCIIENEKDINAGYIKEVCSSVLSCFCDSADVDMHEKEGLLKQINEARYYNELKFWMTELAERLLNRMKLPGAVYSPPIAGALQYIEKNYGDDITLSEVAKCVHLNPEYFSRLFKKETGKNFSIYLVIYRLKKAEELLSSTDKRISDIAERVGYPNLSYFSRLYKKYMGKNAIENRRRAK